MVILPSKLKHKQRQGDKIRMKTWSCIAGVDIPNDKRILAFQFTYVYGISDFQPKKILAAAGNLRKTLCRKRFRHQISKDTVLRRNQG